MNDHRKSIKLIAQRWQITAWKKCDFYFNCNLYLPMLFPHNSVWKITEGLLKIIGSILLQSSSLLISTLHAAH